MPSLALIINEVEQGHYQAVTAQSVRKAAAWCKYLESHAMRIYGGAIDPAARGAETILSRREKLPAVFKVRDIQQKGWTGLSTSEHIKDAVKELVECGYIRAMNEKNPTGGRPSTSYEWNPNIEKKSLSPTIPSSTSPFSINPLNTSSAFTFSFSFKYANPL